MSKKNAPIVGAKPVLVIEDVDIITRVIKGKEVDVVIDKVENFIALLRKCGLSVAFNDMRNRIEFTDIYGNNVSDTVSLDTIESKFAEIAQQYGLTPGFCMKHILHAALLNRYHPAAWLLGNTQWDGTDRVTPWVKLVHAEDANQENVLRAILKAILKCWYGKVEFKFMPVIYSQKNSWRKTSLVKMLGAGIPGGCLAAQFIDGSKDNLMAITSSFVTEIGELEATLNRRAETGKLKSLIGSTEDVYRLPYGRDVKGHPRRTIFISTSNHKRVIRDETLVSRLPYINLTAPVGVEDMQQLMGLTYNNGEYEIVDINEWRQFWAQVRDMDEAVIDDAKLTQKGVEENLERSVAYDSLLENIADGFLRRNGGFSEGDARAAVGAAFKPKEVREALKKLVCDGILVRKAINGIRRYHVVNM